jgi:nitroreductase
MSIVEKLQWRSAIKQFDNSKILSKEQLNELLRATQLSPSSGGLQPYRIIVVQDAETKSKLFPHAFNQAQIVDSTAVIVFAAETHVDADLVKKYIDLIANVRQVGRSTLEGFEQVLNAGIGMRPATENITWAHKQAYLALGVLLAAAAELQIDACPMEGFDPAGFDEVLGLKQKGLTTSVIAAVGYRAETDVFSKLAKVRKPAGELFIHM